MNILLDQPVTRCPKCQVPVLIADLASHREHHESERREMDAIRAQMSELRDRLAVATKGDDQR